jgi:endonuclease G, mitochondrial
MPSREEMVAKYISRLGTRRNLDPLLKPQIRGEEGPTPAHVIENHREASAGVQEILQGRVPSPAQSAGIEAIILPKIRPVLDIVDGDFQTDHPLWQKLNDDQEIRGRLRKAIRSVGRIELPANHDLPYAGTGFVVGKNVIMTNRHVAEIFSSGLGTRQLDFKLGQQAGIDFLRELDRPPGTTIRVRRPILIHPYWDMALLELDGLPDTFEPLQLSLRGFPPQPMTEVAAIGYPAFDYRNDKGEQNDLFRNVFGVKRLLPGTCGGRQDTESFGKTVSALRHNCSTLGGNSGSALIDFDKGEVIALHFGGRFHEINFGVPACELARDQRVVDAGVTFAGTAPGGQPSWKQWWDSADQSVYEITVDRTRPYGKTDPPATSQATTSPASKSIAGGIQFVVPLRISLSLGRPQPPSAVPDKDRHPATEDIEALAEPWHNSVYTSRPGYDERFLDQDFKLPMPEPADASVVAKTKDGGTELKYQNFSIKMHAKRRLALLTAANLTAEAKLKRPEGGRDYNRRGLSGLGDKDQEKWFTDPRLDGAYQLSDYFYTRDNGAFDKGHIVRREDVAWGETYSKMRCANGDTYHVTNCSPQIAEFNRSSLGEDNWGDLENHVLKSAATERLCQFAGPLLDPSDEVFVGKLGNGQWVRLKIPSRFWKVIVARTVSGVAGYGFLLEQDLSAVPLEEFMVPSNFRRLMVPISELQDMAGIKFSPIVLEADQYQTDEGVELAFRSGLKRKSKEPSPLTEEWITQ